MPTATQDWLKYEEIGDLEEQKHSVFFESLAREELTMEETKRQLALQQILATPSLVLYPQAHATDTEVWLMGAHACVCKCVCICV